MEKVKCEDKGEENKTKQTSAIRSDEKAATAGIESEREIVDEWSGSRRRMSVDPWVGEFQPLDLHQRCRILLLRRHN